MESDIGIFDRWLGSMANNPDIVGQIADKTTKLANKWADDLTNKAWDELRMLQEDLKNIGLNNTDIFCEVSARTGDHETVIEPSVAPGAEGRVCEVIVGAEGNVSGIPMGPSQPVGRCAAWIDPTQSHSSLVLAAPTTYNNWTGAAPTVILGAAPSSAVL
jgi:hypothetical protein